MDGEIRAGSEFRVAGRTLTGVVLKYGDIGLARLPGGAIGRERFEQRAFAPVPDVPLIMGHDSTLVIAAPGEYVLTDGDQALTLRAELRANSAALSLVERGALNGFSFEFWPAEERAEAGVRVISKAKLGHVGLVTNGAYPASTAEVRAALDRRRRFWL